LAVGCQGQLPWRFLATKAILFSGSVLEWDDAAGGGEPEGIGVRSDE